jgi:ADP-heptose:LPS heptosyltransferase
MKILILCLPGVGDALMATPMVKVLRKAFPKIQIDLLCIFEGVSHVYKNNPYVDKVFLVSLYKQKKILGLKRLTPFRNKKYDVSILCFPAYRKEYHLVQWFIGARKRIAHKFSKGYFSEFNFLDTILIPFDEDEHHLINNLNLLKAMGVDWRRKNSKKSDFKYDLKLDKEDIEFGKEYIKNLKWKDKQVIGFHPGSVNSPMGLMRRWPIKNFALLGKHLIKKGKKIIIFAGPEELEIGIKLKNLIHDPKNSHLVHDTKFNQSVGILSQVNLLITNDNGFGHLANALKIKTILLVGPTNQKWCSPYDKKYCKIIRKAKFNPWFRNDLKADDPVPSGIKSGMEDITVEDVAREI